MFLFRFIFLYSLFSPRPFSPQDNVILNIFIFLIFSFFQSITLQIIFIQFSNNFSFSFLHMTEIRLNVYQCIPPLNMRMCRMGCGGGFELCCSVASLLVLFSIRLWMIISGTHWARQTVNAMLSPWAVGVR